VFEGTPDALRVNAQVRKEWGSKFELSR